MQEAKIVMDSEVHKSKLASGIYRRINFIELENEYETITSGA